MKWSHKIQSSAQLTRFYITDSSFEMGSLSKIGISIQSAKLQLLPNGAMHKLKEKIYQAQNSWNQTKNR